MESIGPICEQEGPPLAALLIMKPVRYFNMVLHFSIPSLFIFT